MDGHVIHLTFFSGDRCDATGLQIVFPFFYLPLTKFFCCLALTILSPSLACFRNVCFGLVNLMSPCWCRGKNIVIYVVP